jgi:anti-sigma factor (TIGR02949 family)
MSCAQVERDLDAYLDRELDAEPAQAIRSHISACADCRRHVAERKALSCLVRSAPYYSAPERMRVRVLAQTTRSQLVRRVLGWAAAAVAVVSVAGGISFLPTGPVRGDVIAEAAIDSHMRSLMANHLLDVQSTDQHTVKPWFLGKLDFSPPVIDLAAIGFPLVGGRLDYLGGRPVAALVYERRQHAINVFVSPDDGAAAARTSVRSIRGFHIHHWVRHGMAFWVVSDADAAELAQFCQALQASP